MIDLVAAILFSPRGGSAHVARALARGLRARGNRVTLVAGSGGDLGGYGDARAFYGDVSAIDFGPALASGAPLRFEGPAGTAPMHPSFEDRPGAHDCVFARLDDLAFERQVRAWSAALNDAGAHQADLLHLHHLTPLNEAAARVAAGVPVLGQLHGTELLMLEKIAAGPPPNWGHAPRWAERLQGWAQACDRLVAAPAGVERAAALLDVPRELIVSLPNGVDTDLFSSAAIDRKAFWREVLVEHPQGWLPNSPAGSARYEQADVDRLSAGTVLLYVGRFTAVKRLDRLIKVFQRAQERSPQPAGLVLVGGHPGEWEDEHPAEVAERLGARNVFLAGWHGQEELPRFFSAADAVVIASDREQFGQVLIEGMSCGLPVVATHSLGPASIVEEGSTGWLAQPDDEEAFAQALLQAIVDPDERQRRGELARAVVCQRFSWSGVSARLEAIMNELVGPAPRTAAVPS